MSMYPEGTVALMTDNEVRSLSKIVQLGGGGGGAGSGGITSAAGAPPTDGSVSTLFYKDTSTGAIYINTGTEAVPVWDAI